MLFSAFTILCKYHPCLVPKPFPHPKRKLCSHSPYPQSLATTNLHSVSMNWSILDISINGVLQYVAFYVWCLSLSMFAGSADICSISQYFLPFDG